MVDPDWIEHRRGSDRELLGWMAPEGEGFVAIDLLGHRRTEPVDWLEAEEALEALGIGYLAERYELLLDTGEWLRVRIAEASSEVITLRNDDWAVGVVQLDYSLRFPVGDGLRLADTPL